MPAPTNTTGTTKKAAKRKPDTFSFGKNSKLEEKRPRYFTPKREAKTLNLDKGILQLLTEYHEFLSQYYKESDIPENVTIELILEEAFTNDAEFTQWRKFKLAQQEAAAAEQDENDDNLLEALGSGPGVSAAAPRS